MASPHPDRGAAPLVPESAGVLRVAEFRGPHRPLAAVSVADAAVGHVRSLLFSGELAAGEELRDTVLAAELGIARPTARVAVQRLVSEGLLEREPGHSARVRTFSAGDVADLYRVRELVETEAVRRIVDEDWETRGVAEALHAFAAAGETWEAGADADAAFHTAVVDAAGSVRLSRMFSAIVSEMRLMIALLRGRYGSLSELCDEHTELLGALEAARAGGADRLGAVIELWRHHIEDATTFLTDVLDPSSAAAAPHSAIASDRSAPTTEETS